MQVLYGMGISWQALVEKGYRVRVYCYGELLPGMAYLILTPAKYHNSSFRQSLEEQVEELCFHPSGKKRS